MLVAHRPHCDLPHTADPCHETHCKSFWPVAQSTGCFALLGYSQWLHSQSNLTGIRSSQPACSPALSALRRKGHEATSARAC